MAKNEQQQPKGDGRNPGADKRRRPHRYPAPKKKTEEKPSPVKNEKNEGIPQVQKSAHVPEEKKVKQGNPAEQKKQKQAPVPAKPKYARGGSRRGSGKGAPRQKDIRREIDEALESGFLPVPPAPAVRAPENPKPEKAEKPAKTVPSHFRFLGGKRPKLPTGKLKVMSLGGLNEIGKNITVLEYEDDIIVVDCGLGFPDEEMPGIDLVIPDITYLEQNREKIRGIFFTHGHEDHIGGVPYILRSINPPLYGTRLTLGIIKNKLEEHTLPNEPKLNCVKAGDTVRAGAFSVEFIHVNHSIADACCLAIHTPLGTVVHTGDFKLDLTPIDGEIMDIGRLSELGREGVLLLLSESTNAERPGYTPSEKKVGKSLEYIFTTNPEKRIVIATFSSNVHRVQQIIDASARHGRKVAVTGRSMLNILNAAVELGYMTVPEGTLIDISEIKRFKPTELTLITTGSQGEPMSALYRMAFGDHAQVTLGENDLVVLSSSAIPGNEKLVGRIINELSKNGVEVLHDSVVEVHVSGHACREELKLMQALTRPKYFMPIHGEFRHLSACRELAREMGIPDDRIFISDLGKVFVIDENGARFDGTVPSGVVLVDGYGVGDVGNIVLRDRKHLSQDGLIVVVASIDLGARLLLSGPDIVSRGFVYVRESEDLMDEARKIAQSTIEDELSANGNIDRIQLKNRVKDDLSKFLYTKTKRKPMILPIVMDL